MAWTTKSKKLWKLSTKKDKDGSYSLMLKRGKTIFAESGGLTKEEVSKLSSSMMLYDPEKTYNKYFR